MTFNIKIIEEGLGHYYVLGYELNIVVDWIENTRTPNFFNPVICRSGLRIPNAVRFLKLGILGCYYF